MRGWYGHHWHGTLLPLYVLDRDLSTPPSTPAYADTYIVASGGTGAWSGHDGELAYWTGTAWQFAAIDAGTVLWMTDEGKWLVQTNTTIDQVQVGAGGGGVTFKNTTIAFTDGDTMRRVTITDADVTSSSKIVGTITRPDTATDSADKGYLYTVNVVRRAAGVFDLLVSCLGWGFDDTTPNPPNETINFQYIVGA